MSIQEQCYKIEDASYKADYSEMLIIRDVLSLLFVAEGNDLAFAKQFFKERGMI